MDRIWKWLAAAFLVLMTLGITSTYTFWHARQSVVVANESASIETIGPYIIVSNLTNTAELEHWSPIIGKLLLTKYFGQLTDKPLPVVRILTRQDYLTRWDPLSHPESIHELGRFAPATSTIYIVVDPLETLDVPSYLETLTHEYLHYLSYVSPEVTLPTPIEEGLTEYYARKVIYTNFGIQTDIGYPTLTKLVSQLASKIPDAKLQAIYFSKDRAGLQHELDQAYGHNFYNVSQNYFSLLLNSTDAKANVYAQAILAQIHSK